MANDSLKIIVEKNVPFLEVLDSVADVIRLNNEDITPKSVKDADALIVRTRTRCDASLLEGAKVQFIASATIGTDHIDLDWCSDNNIKVANAPGCNAPAVAQYVFSSIMRVINRQLSSYRIGIVGVGHVGSIVEKWARAMSMPVMLCDLPRQLNEGGDKWHTLDDIARWADIITFHTPLTKSPAPFPTYHLADGAFFKSLRRAPIIINSSRGDVVDNHAWLEALKCGQCGPAIIDCWENEPQINLALLNASKIATPHIAGYSMEGKQRASQMVLDALCNHFNLPPMKISSTPPKPCAASITPAEALASYDPEPDSVALKSHPASFEQLRNNYILRSEPADRPNK